MASKMHSERPLPQDLGEVLHSGLHGADPDVLPCLFEGPLNLFELSLELKERLRFILFFKRLVDCGRALIDYQRCRKEEYQVRWLFNFIMDMIIFTALIFL